MILRVKEFYWLKKIKLNAEITTTILSEMGYVVKAVEDGILCVNEMLHQPANTYDLILMDIQIPNML